MARFGIDGWAVSPDGRGHARTQRRAIEALAGAASEHAFVAFVRSRAAAELLPQSVERVVVGDRVAVQWEQVGLPRAQRRHRLDATLTLTERLPLAGAGRYAVWLFELPTHRIEANVGAGAGLYQRASDVLTRAMWTRSLRRAAAVAAGSRATADELETAVPELRGRVRVVYPGLDPLFGRDMPRGQAPGPGRYVLHLGSADPRDNTQTAVEAFALARARVREPVRLLVAGGWDGDADGVEALGRVTDDELVALYRGAAAYLDATLYEGFGYVPLEAMASGAPVVASRASSIPEVVGDAGILCDPRSPEALSDALVRVLDDAALADDLRHRGRERAQLFTWERAGRELLELLESAVAA